MLCDWHRNTGDVDLLEAVPAQKGDGHVGCDGNDGNRIHVCGGDTSDQIGSAWSGGSHADADLSGGSRIAVRRVGSSLLMGGEDVTDLLVMFIEFIIDIQDRAAGITENGIHSLLFQTFYNDLGTC